MNKESTVQHVQIPDPNGFNDLKLIDRLVYANIKRYMNKDTYTCYPSIQTIADKCKITKKVVFASLKRLVKFGYLTILDEKHGRNNIYKFEKLKSDFEQFSNEFLDNDKITPDEKAYLIGLQSQCYKTKEYALTSYTNQEIANNLNISLRNVNRYNTSLKNKEIMTELQTTKYDETGFKKMVKAIELSKIGQQFLFEIAINHEDRIQQLEKMIKILIKENQDLKKRLIPNYPTEYNF